MSPSVAMGSQNRPQVLKLKAPVPWVVTGDRPTLPGLSPIQTGRRISSLFLCLHSTPMTSSAPAPIPFDALLLVSFGGPEGMSDVIPFLENVLRGRNVPRERLLEVAAHYEHFQGVSPINAHVRDLMSRLQQRLPQAGIDLPLYWGNRNWHPLLADTVQQMTEDGVRRALAFVTSAYSSYSSCRQYLEDLERARAVVGPEAPAIEKLRVFYNHPRFVAATVDRVRDALAQIPQDRQARLQVAYTAHSIPLSMARTSRYAEELAELCRLVSAATGVTDDRWNLVYQSRSGRPEDPWLEPDICDHLRTLRQTGVQDVVVMPIGFLSDHIEVLYDLDFEARQLAGELGLNLLRASTVGTHPEFIEMIVELIQERLQNRPDRPAVGQFPARPDWCAADCCPAPRRGN